MSYLLTPIRCCPKRLPRFLWLSGFVLCLILPSDMVWAQNRDEQNKLVALRKLPTQKEVDADSPNVAEADKCSIEPSTKTYGGRGFVVRNPAGSIVRLYQQKPDGGVHWTFFKNGNEVYREIDSNGDRKIDQYRWMGEAGSRWGIDTNQDGTIDSWKVISAEGVAYEAFRAFQSSDHRRLSRLCLNNNDLKALKLGQSLQQKVAGQVTKTLKALPALVQSQSRVTRSSTFVDFSGSRPSLVPAGKMGLESDLTIFDNTAALFSNGDEIGNIALGTLINVGDRWCLVELPEIVSIEKGTSNGRFFDFPPVAGEVADAGENPVNDEVTKLIAQYTELDQKLRGQNAAAGNGALYQQRTDLILKIAAATENAEDRSLWVRMCASEASVGYQSGRYEKGLDALKKLAASPLAENDRDFVDWELLQASTRDTRKGSAAEVAKANEAHMESLAEFVSKHPKSENTAQALLQLAMFEEFSTGRDSADKAVEWYETAASNFPDTHEGQFAAGAKKRLTSYGQPLALSGTTLSNRKLDTASFRGKKIVVIHYWSTLEPLSLADFTLLVKLRSKYKDEVAIVGVNLDDDAEAAKNYLKSKQRDADWQHLWAAGGKQDSVHALELGVITLPLTLLIDQKGEVVENQIITDQLDREVYRLRNR